MAVYEFQNRKTGKKIEKSFKMGECPEFILRGKTKYHRVFSVGSVGVKKQRLGSIIDENTKRAKDKGLVKPSKKKERPWWRTTDKPNLKLATLTKKQKESYVRTGKY